MEIIYLWIRDYPPFEENDFSFNGRFNVDFNKVEDAKTITINITENQLFPKNLFGDVILNISCIIGKNGSGKTKLIDFLKLIDTEDWHTISNYFLVTFDNDNNEFSLKHNMYQLSEGPFNYQFFKGSKLYDIIVNLPEGYSLGKAGNQKKSQIVYYSPFLDLKNFPIKFDTKPYIDVSTDFLVMTDMNTCAKDNPDVLKIHRFKNIERQFEFVNRFQENLAVNTIIAIPETIEVYSLEQNYDQHWRHNLSYTAQEVRAYFIGDGTSIRRGILFDRIYEIGGIIHEINLAGQTGSDEYRALEIETRELYFLEGLIDHYFSAWNSINYWKDFDIGISINEFDGMNMLEACQHFLNSQRWTIDHGKSGVIFLEFIIELFKSSYTEISSYSNQRVVKTNNKDLVLNLIKSQEEYLKSLPSNSRNFKTYDVIQIDWRNISSGEKAFLDLFSRLNYANSELKFRERDKYSGVVNSVEWLYLYIDEGEIGFHPEWQKKYLDLLHKMVPVIFSGLKIQIILTSHSPFIASDLPFQNITFLDKIDGRVKVNIELNFQNTFAANIHTLLADGFFLSGGLIGDFSKKKIQDIIDWINNDNADKTNAREIKKILNLIGEPIVRNRLLEEYNRKIGIDIEIDMIDEELRRLQTLKDDLLKRRDNAET